MELTLEELRAIMPRLSRERAKRYLPLLNAAMDEAAIHTPLRAAAFLATLAHESGELRFWEEFASGLAYEGRKRLGNTQPGDGRRYKGRGPIQITGRANYREAGEALGLALEQHPRLAALPEHGFRVAAWFWTARRCNAPADEGDFEGVTRIVNGGLNGWPARLVYYRRALDLFGVLPTT